MLALNYLSIFQFRNYQEAVFQFPERITGICGKNGVGKTNLLDAIYYLCFTKSYFGNNEWRNCYEGTNGFRLEGRFQINQLSHQVVAILRENGKKEFSIDKEPYERFSSHIGRFPAIMIAPDDVQLIIGGAEERRRFLDALISQIDMGYLEDLIQYNKVLQQRNSLLKSIAELNDNTNWNVLEVLDYQLAQPGTRIWEKRKSFLHDFFPEVFRFYLQIAGKDDEVNIHYESPLNRGSFSDIIRENRSREIQVQRTLAGIHRDDLEFKLGNHLFRNIASQGQRKSLLFALKLAAFTTIRKLKGFPPILLLDDIFEKLDEERMANLLHWTCVQNDGQIFITDTHCERLRSVLNDLGSSYQIEMLGS